MLIVLIVSLGALAYTLVGYPLLLLALWAVRGRSPGQRTGPPLNVDVVIPAHNEAAVIAGKLRNLLAQANPDGHRLRVVVVSDGSTDATADEARAVDDPRVTLRDTGTRLGKLEALNWILPDLSGDVVVFTDANALLGPGALAALLAPLADPEVGGVCGRIGVAADSTGAIGRAEGSFWSYDQWLKRAESDLGGAVSAQGALYALRRSLVAPVPAGVADDFLMSVRAVEAGFRLAFAPDALAREAVTERAGAEFGRRVRSTEMGWRGLMRMAHLMNPGRFGLYAWQLISHKLMRRLMPFFLGAALVSNLALWGTHPALTALAGAQVAVYGLAAAAYAVPGLRRLPGAGKAMFFVAGNVAMALGLLAWARGRKSSLWTPVRAEP